MIKTRKILALLLSTCLLFVAGCRSNPNTWEDFSASSGDVSTITSIGDSVTSSKMPDVTVGVKDPAGTSSKTPSNTSNTSSDTTTPPSNPSSTTPSNPSSTTPSNPSSTTDSPFLDPSVKTETDVNLAKGKTVTSNSKKIAAFTDGNTTSVAFSGANGQKATFVLDLGKQCTFNEIWLYESADKNQMVGEFSIYIQKGDKWEFVYKQDEIGSKRVCAIPAVTAQKIKVEVTATRGAYALCEIEVVNAASRKHNGDFRITSYIVPEWESFYFTEDPSDLPDYFSVSTDIMVMKAFAYNVDGDIVASAENIKAFATLRKAADAVKTHKVRMHAVVELPSGSEAATMTGSNKTKIINNLVDFAIRHKFDGLSFDWEYPYSASNWNAFSDFLVDLKKEMKKHNLRLSVALGPWGVKLTSDAIASIDYVEAMLYDLADSTKNHASYDLLPRSLNYFIDLGFKAEQIDLGLAFYAKNSSDQILAGYNFYAQNPEFKMTRWDNLLTGGIYINGCQMIRDKTVFAIHEKVGGVMIWSFGYDIEESVNGLSLYDEIREVKEQYLK